MMSLVAVRESAAGGTFLLEHMTVRLTATAHFTDFCPFVCVKKGDLWESGVLSWMEKATKTAKTSRKRILVLLWFGQGANAFTLERNS